jgi:hypothetical protein
VLFTCVYLSTEFAENHALWFGLLQVASKGAGIRLYPSSTLSYLEMDFDDIFGDAEDTVLTPAYVASYNSQLSSAIGAISKPQEQASSSRFTSSLIGLLFILAIYWIVSFSLSYKQKLNRKSIELSVYGHSYPCVLRTNIASLAHNVDDMGSQTAIRGPLLRPTKML